MKQIAGVIAGLVVKAAAFRRLCIETLDNGMMVYDFGLQPPSGGCVLKLTPYV